MEVLYLLKREIKEPIRLLVLFVILSSMSNALLIGIINTAAEYASNSDINATFFLLFILGAAVSLLAKKYVLDKSGVMVELVMCRIRNRLADKIRHAELIVLETTGTSPLYARLTQDTTIVSNVSTTIISSIQSAVMIGFTLLYVATISIGSFLIAVSALGIAVIQYFRRSSSFFSKWFSFSTKEAAFFGTLEHILKGFKEIKINRSKSEGVFENYKMLNEALRNDKKELNSAYNILLIYSQTFFYLLFAGILFILPRFYHEHSEDVIKVTASLLFIMGPFESVITSLQMFDNANNAARNLVVLEEQLEAELKKNKYHTEHRNHPWAYEQLPYFDNIQLQNLSFSYPPTKENDQIFTVGPVNLSFQKGELIFITGGNGSGKSTFLKLLTGLYTSQTGRIVVDGGLEDPAGRVVGFANYQQYRNLFATIFTDFHLFDKLYGLTDIDPHAVQELLKNMALSAEKTTYENGRFTNLQLSTGQKKRLALTTAIIEDKPIYIFDEVAADLDPEFRDKYYYEILGELKERNKTVIVVSHDQHYWSIADRLLEMRNGMLRELSKSEVHALLALSKQSS